MRALCSEVAEESSSAEIISTCQRLLKAKFMIKRSYSQILMRQVSEELVKCRSEGQDKFFGAALDQRKEGKLTPTLGKSRNQITTLTGQTDKPSTPGHLVKRTYENYSKP